MRVSRSLCTDGVMALDLVRSVPEKREGLVVGYLSYNALFVNVGAYTPRLNNR